MLPVVKSVGTAATFGNSNNLVISLSLNEIILEAAETNINVVGSLEIKKVTMALVIPQSG